MAITDIVLSGKLYQDDGDAVSGATVALLETGTTTSEATTTTDSNGAWTFTEPDLDTTYDIKITSGTSVRYILWSDEITTKGVDTASLKVRGANAAAAPIYLFADRADDAGDGWRIQATASDTLTIGSDKASAGTIIDYLTITNGASAAASVAAFGGDLTVGDDLSLTSDSAVFNMGAGNDFTITHDGTTGATIAGNPVTITASGASTWSTSSGALTITSAAALNLNPAGGSAILLDGTISVDAGVVTGATAITSQTIDATTDFTIGTTVITDDSIVMTPSTDDTVTIAAATNGVLNITTVDTAAAAANLNIVVDGAVDVDAAGAINLDAGSGIWTFEDSGTEVLRITESGSGDVTIKLETNGKDLIFTDNGDATNMTIKDAAAGIVVPGEVMTTKVSYTDGDDAITIADGGGITAAQDISTTDAKYIKLGGSRMATAEPASDSTGYGIVIGFDSAGSVSAGDAVCINSSGKVAQANANAGSVTDPAIGIATNAAGSDGDDCYVLTHGIWRLDAEAFQAGDPVYVGESAGALTKDVPNDDGDYVQRIGVAVSDDVIFVMPSIDVIEHA